MYLYHTLLTQCNWNCKYCDFPNIENKCIDINMLEEYFRLLKTLNSKLLKDVNWYFEGGEIGLLPSSIMSKLFENKIIPQYCISTNGLFIKNGFYKKYYSQIKEVYYHINLDDIKLYKDDKIINVVVATKYNLEKLINTIKNNSDYFFNIQLYQPRLEDYKNLLNKNELIYLYENIKNLNNISKNIINRLSQIIKLNNMYNRIDNIYCANTYTKLNIDLVNWKIKRCCVSYNSNSVKLSKNNFEKVLKNEFLFPPIEDRCKHCIAHPSFMNYEWSHLKNKIWKYYFKNVS